MINTVKNQQPWTNAYWQYRVVEMSKVMIEKKMAMSKCKRSEAEAGFRKWILEKCYIRIGSFETLTVNECKSIVSFLYRHQGAFKNTYSPRL